MRRDITLLRAVASVILHRHVTRLFAVPVVVLACFSIVLAWFMVSYGKWWVVCFVLSIAMLFIASSAWLLSVITAQVLSPKKLSRSERRDIAGFSDRVVALTGQVRTPLPLLGLRLVWDMLVYRDLRTLRSLIANSDTLRSDYQTLKNKLN